MPFKDSYRYSPHLLISIRLMELDDNKKHNSLLHHVIGYWGETFYSAGLSDLRLCYKNYNVVIACMAQKASVFDAVWTIYIFSNNYW